MSLTRSYSMYTLVNAGRAMFATGIFLLGLLCMVNTDFIAGRPPAWPAAFNPNPLLGYFTGSLMMLAAVAIVCGVSARMASAIIALLLLCFSVLRHLPFFMNDWANAYKSIALLGGAVMIAASYNYFPVAGANEAPVRRAIAKLALPAGSMALAVFFIACSYAHFRYASFVKSIIPSYIPYGFFWTFFSGACLLAAGIGLLLPTVRSRAALWAGIMITGWFFLLHIPRLAADPENSSDRMGVAESLAIAGICFSVAAMAQKRINTIE